MLLVIAVVLSMGEWHGAPGDWLAARGAPGTRDSCLIIEKAAPPKKASTPPAPRRQAPRLVRRAAFTMVIPPTAQFNEEQPLSFSLRTCRYFCGISVHLFTDSAGTGMDGYIAELMRQERRVDSVNNDPRTTVRELHDYHGPPLTFTTPAGRVIALDGACGDCGAASLFFERHRLIAEIRLNADDREPGGARLLCQLATIARTFRWRE